MTDIFSTLRHFTREEHWGIPEKMDGRLLLVLDELREQLGEPVVIHEGYAEGGHVQGSEHYTGMAADFSIRNSLSFRKHVQWLHMFLNVYQLNSGVSLGIYPEWKHPGFHLGTGDPGGRWGRIGDVYVSEEEIIRYMRELDAVRARENA